MIERYKCEFGVTVDLDLGSRYGAKVEIECIEFVGALPIDWKLGDLPWRSGSLRGVHDAMRGFHDLQAPTPGGTRGYPAAAAKLESRGIGDCALLVWLRDGTYSKRSEPLQIVGQG